VAASFGGFGEKLGVRTETGGERFPPTPPQRSFGQTGGPIAERRQPEAGLKCAGEGFVAPEARRRRDRVHGFTGAAQLTGGPLEAEAPVLEADALAKLPPKCPVELALREPGTAGEGAERQGFVEMRGDV